MNGLFVFAFDVLLLGEVGLVLKGGAVLHQSFDDHLRSWLFIIHAGGGGVERVVVKL